MTLHLSNGWWFDINETLTSEAHAVVALGDRLAAAGWVILSSSNTATINAITRNDTTRWNNSNAWEHWRDPGGNRDLTIQRGASNRSWRLYLGQYGDVFVGSGLSVSPVGSLPMVQLVGAAGAFDTTFIPTPFANFEYHIGASQVGAGQSSDVFEFYLCIQSNTTTTVSVFRAVFAVSTPATGVHGVVDFDPWICLPNVTTPSGYSGVIRGLVATELGFNTLAGYQTGTQLNPYSGEYDLCPMLVVDTTGGQEQRKGVSRTFLYFSTATPAALDTINNATEGRSMVRFGSYIVPWPHGVTTGTTGVNHAAAPIYGGAEWPYLATGGWANGDPPVAVGALQLVLPTDLSSTSVDVRNRVWDTVAGGWHVWVTNNGADPTGISYDGPGTYGVDTSNYSVI